MPDSPKKNAVVQPTRDIFRECLNESFEILLGDGESIELELIEYDELPRATNRDDIPIRDDPFSLIFKGQTDGTLAQGTYALQHERNGTIQLFLVPVGFGEYQAIIN